jgi:uncharacterized protein YidB (DUF937 family)
MRRNRKLLIGAVALLAAAGGGVAIAASDNSPGEESQAVINDAAQQLGVSPSKLSDALKKALSDRVDAAVAAGRITKEEGDALKQRIDSDEYPLFLGPHPGFGFHHLGKLDAAASYIGISEEQLRTELESGKTLAQVAQAHGKSADGLVDALVAAAKKHVDAAVAAGRLTQAQADQMLNDLRDRITSMVNSRPPDNAPRFGFRHFWRPA